MKVTIIGSGNMGAAFAKLLTRSGHQVRIVGRRADKASAVAAANRGASAVAATHAADGADVVIVATGYSDAVPALSALGSLDGKVVVDVTNPLTADYMGLTVGHTTSAGEEIATALPGADVVKAFNTVFAQVLADGPDFANGETAPVFLASDSAPAKEVVRSLVESTGFRAVDAGALKNARYLEPLAGLNIYLGYGAGLGTGIAPTWIHRA